MHDAIKGDADPIVFYVGANVGHYSLFASTIAKHVHAFEPYPRVYAKIYEKIKLNALTNITVHQVGLGEVDEEIPYTIPPDYNLGQGSFLSDSAQVGERIPLPIRVGDDYISTLKLPRVNLIKMDIEGFEPQALRGLAKTINRYRPIILFEWSANERGLNVSPSELFPSDYRLFILKAKPVILGFFTTEGYRIIIDQAPYNGSSVIERK